MSEWTGRQLTIVGAFSVLLVLIGIGIIGSMSSDMWEHRARIQSSAEASCTQADTDCAQKDLPAQVRSASAAEAMADITFWQLILGGFGLCVGAITMGAAIFAALFAKEAAEHNRAAVGVSREGLDHARENERRTLRAYVTAEPAAQFSNTGIGDKATLAVTFRNAGQTPVIRFQPLWGLSVEKLNDVAASVPQFPTPEAFFAEHSEDGVSFADSYLLLKTSPEVMTPENHAAVIAGEKHLCLYGVAYYIDIFGDLHQTTMLFSVTRDFAGHPQLEVTRNKTS